MITFIIIWLALLTWMVFHDIIIHDDKIKNLYARIKKIEEQK